MKTVETMNDPEAERGVLGCCLNDPMKRVFEVYNRCGNAAVELFHDLRHRAIWGALLDSMQGVPSPDILSLAQSLRGAGELDNIGGVAYLTELQDAMPSAENLPYYLDAARDVALRRKAGAFFKKAYDALAEGDRAKEQLEQAAGGLMGLTADPGAQEVRRLGELFPAILEEIENYKRGGAQLSGLSTGFGYLDKITGGMRGGEMTIIAGRPGGGKTAFAMNVAVNVALTGSPVLVFSMEMSAVELAKRVIGAHGRVDMQRFRTGFAEGTAFPDLSASIHDLEHLPLYVDERPALTMNQVLAKAKEEQLLHGIGLVVVDYLQLARSDEVRNYSREQEVAAISRGLRRLAKELNVPVLACAQLNRNAAQSRAQKPSLVDLRESGQIEQDADFVGALWEVPEEKEAAGDWSRHEVRTDLLVLKQRSGSTANHAEYIFKKDYVRFFEYKASDMEEAKSLGL